MISRAVKACVAVAAAGVLAFAGSALASSAAPTSVTIKKQSDGFFGFVSSTKPNRCANGRKIVLYREKGDTPSPSSDQKIGTDIAQPNGDGYEWSTGNSGNQKGSFYAFAHRIPGCKKGISKVVTR
jgi:hypothetical protein